MKDEEDCDTPGGPTGPKASSVGGGERHPEPVGAYEVGRGKPPKHTRFKPGRSGNPRGRPKKHKNVRTIVRDVFTQPVVVTRNGKRKTVPAIEAAIQRMLGEALQGNWRTLAQVVQIVERAGLMNEDPGATSAAPLSAEDEALITAFLGGQRTSLEPETDGGSQPAESGEAGAAIAKNNEEAKA